MQAAFDPAVRIYLPAMWHGCKEMLVDAEIIQLVPQLQAYQAEEVSSPRGSLLCRLQTGSCVCIGCRTLQGPWHVPPGAFPTSSPPPAGRE